MIVAKLWNVKRLEEELVAIEKLNLLEHIMRRYRILCTPTEQIVVQFIYMRTIKWNKAEEVITLDQFLNGVALTNVQGDKLETGINVPKRTVQRAVASLIKKGIVRKKRYIGYMYSYGLAIVDELPMLMPHLFSKEGMKAYVDAFRQQGKITVDGNVIYFSEFVKRAELLKKDGLKESKQKESKSMKVRFPKSIKNQEDSISNAPKVARQQAASGALNTINLKNKPINCQPTAVTSSQIEKPSIQEIKENLEGINNKVLETIAKKREDKKQDILRKAKNSFYKASELLSFWDKTLKDNNPSMSFSAGSQKDGAMLKTLASKLSLSKDTNILEFMEWVIVNWSNIKGTNNHWQSNFPAQPTPAIVLGFRQPIVNLFDNYRNNLSSKKVTTSDDRLVRHYIKQGLSEQEALKKVEENLANNAASQALAAKEEKLKEKERALAEKEKELIVRKSNILAQSNLSLSELRKRTQSNKDDTVLDAPKVSYEDAEKIIDELELPDFGSYDDAFKKE